MDSKMDGNRKRLLAMVHIGKKELKLDDQAYRDLLYTVTGVDSARELTESQLERVCARMRELGWTPKARTEAPSLALHRPAPARVQAPAPVRDTPAYDKAPLLRKIRQMLADSGKGEAYGNAMAKRIAKTDKLEWATPEGLRKVLAALNYDAKRKSTREGSCA